jgi:Sortilin, neurotensin receptor 3,
MKTTLTLVLTLSVALPLAAQSRRRATTAPCPIPGCMMVNGTPGVTFSCDEGRTLAPRAQTLSGVGYTYGLAALDTPGAMLSWHKSTLSLSNDNGCSWQPVGDFATDFPPTITPARGGRAFAWSDNRQFILRYDSRGATVLKAPAVIVGLGTDHANGNHVRAGDTDGNLWNSTDAGDSWTAINNLPALANSFVYRFSFDPANIDHIIAGRVAGGAYVTFDGGKHWERTSFGDGFNVMNFAMSPADPNVVWAMAVDTRSGVHAMHRSIDGGRTFAQVVAEGGEVFIQNQPVMAAHPTDPNVLYYTHGVNFPEPTVNLYRVQANGTVTFTTNRFAGFNAIVFSPQDPAVMYLGLATVQGQS